MTAGSLLRDLAWTVGLGAGGALVSVLVGSTAPLLLWFGLSLAVVASCRLLGRIAVSGDSVPLVREDSGARAYQMPDRPFAAMRGWEERLELVRGDADYFRRAVVPMLTELVEERLRLAYGVDPHREPERAREVLGPRLTDVLYGEPVRAGRVPSRSELTTLVTEMEKLWTNHR